MNIRWKVLGAFIVGLAGVVSALITILDYEEGRESPKPRYALSDPAPNQIQKKPCTFEASGTGLPRSGKDIAIAVQETGGGGRIYFESAVEKYPGQNKWKANLVIGDKETAPETRFTIAVVVMNADLEKYLSGTTDIEGATFWSSLGWPPNSQVATTATVRRQKSTC